MPHARAHRLALAVYVVLALALPAAAHAQRCADANMDGAVTDTDAVLILRAAALLSSSATLRIADLDLDGQITDTDGVLALRAAVGLPGTGSCVAQQVSAVTDRSAVALRIGVAAIPGSAIARAAQTTVPCPGGGFIEVQSSSEQHHDCSENGIVTNGQIVFDDDPGVFRDVYQGFSLRDLATGEVILVTGTLSFFDGDPIEVSGALANSSNQVGDYTDDYAVNVDDQGSLISGDIFTDVTAGFGVFGNVDAIDFTFLKSGLTDVTIFYTNGSTGGFVVAENLCNPCLTDLDCGDGQTECFVCDNACTGFVPRCSVDFSLIDCGDGNFGPTTTCAPCQSASDCDPSQGCFECDHGCTGSGRRCSSTQLIFLNCGDGFY